MPSRPIILPVLRKSVEPTAPVSVATATNEKKPRTLRFRQKRRRRKNDRRQDVRNGVIVSLSFNNDRRKSPDRRRV